MVEGVKYDSKERVRGSESKSEATARGGTPIWNRRGCSSEILNLTPKGDHLGVAQAFGDP